MLGSDFAQNIVSKFNDDFKKKGVDHHIKAISPSSQNEIVVFSFPKTHHTDTNRDEQYIFSLIFTCPRAYFCILIILLYPFNFKNKSHSEVHDLIVKELSHTDLHSAPVGITDLEALAEIAATLGIDIAFEIRQLTNADEKKQFGLSFFVDKSFSTICANTSDSDKGFLLPDTRDIKQKIADKCNRFFADNKASRYLHVDIPPITAAQADGDVCLRFVICKDPHVDVINDDQYLYYILCDNPAAYKFIMLMLFTGSLPRSHKDVAAEVLSAVGSIHDTEEITDMDTLRLIVSKMGMDIKAEIDLLKSLEKVEPISPADGSGDVKMDAESGDGDDDPISPPSPKP